MRKLACMQPKQTIVRLAWMGMLLVLVGCGQASAQWNAPLSSAPPPPPANAPIPALNDVGIDQKIGNAVPLDASFVDEGGRNVKLGDYFGAKPVVLQLAYFSCPLLCPQVLNGMAGSLEALSFDAGRDFTMLVVSFDPGDTPAMAQAKRADALSRYHRAGVESGVHFLTGREADIKRLTDAVGFRYKYDPAIHQYAHPATIMVLTADGHVSRYLLGIEFAPKDLKFGLMEAAGNRLGSVVDQVVLFCYHYDPTTGKYGFAVTTAVRIGGVLTVLALAAFIVLNLRRERRQANAVRRTATGIR
jgi:protein SCO1/2